MHTSYLPTGQRSCLEEVIQFCVPKVSLELWHDLSKES